MPKANRIFGQGEDLVKQLINQDNKVIEFDLDNWVNDFEDGFTKFQKINPQFKDNYWGQGFTNRPRIKELNEEVDAQTIEGYRVVEFFPDRDVKDESYILFGTPLELMSQISLMMNLHLKFGSGGMEAFLGYPVDEYLRLKPRTGITIQFWLTTYERPPFYKRGIKWFSKRQITIPDVDRRKLTYKNFRAACGASSGQDWGEWSARAYVSSNDDTKGIGQIVAGGTTETKAYENLDKFVYFTKGTIRGRTANKIDYSVGNRSKDPDKEKYRSFNVYPAWVSVLSSKLVALDDARRDGKKTISGRMLSKHNKMFIYPTIEPKEFASNLSQVLAKGKAD